MCPKLYHSNKRQRKLIIGVDEVGVGPLAGPLTACAVSGLEISNLRDSKQLSAKQRKEFYDLFCNNKKIIWAVASVLPKTIDKINILQARKRAMERAVKKLLAWENALVLIDGNIALNLAAKQQSIIKGDERVPIIAAASIIAKVTRDRAMVRYHKKYPQYRFDLHKGYGTRLHYEMLATHGPCAIHRRSFRLG